MKRIDDLVGKRFGLWLVLSRAPNNANGKTQWHCKCDCGTCKDITTCSLRTYNSTSCGCIRTDDLTGTVHGVLTVLRADHSTCRRKWLCRCECGAEMIVSFRFLKRDQHVVCGHDVKVIDLEPRRRSEALRLFSTSNVRRPDALSARNEKLNDKIIVLHRRYVPKRAVA